MLLATAACNFSTSELQKVLREWQFFHILACKCASSHSGVPFLNIGTSKIAPRLWCFVHFDLQMCFAPQRRAIFEHRNFKNCSEIVVFCAFDLQMCFRHSGVPFFICLLNNYLRTRRFSEATFRTSGTTNH